MTTDPVSEPAVEEFFRTDHLRDNLHGRAMSGGVVTAASQATYAFLQIVSQIILARLLTPLDFGLVFMVLSITAFLGTFKEAGLSTATIQRDGITHAQVSNLFWTNIGLSISICVVTVLCAPIIAWFYHDPRLVKITLAIALTFLFSGAAVQHRALLNRQMRFLAVAAIDVGSAFCGLVAGIAAALLGWGYWSLVVLQVVVAAAELMITWSVSSWRPGRFSRNSDTRSMLNFGVSMTISSLLRRFARGGDTILVGRFHGTEAVGLYSRASALLMRPMEQFMNPFDAVFVPVLSRLQDQPERYRRAFLQVFGGMAMSGFPFAALLYSLASPIVLLLFGPQWKDVIPIFEAFSLSALFIPLVFATTWLLTTQGRTKDILKAGIIASVVSVGSFAVGLPFGPAGVALAYSIGGLLVRMPLHFRLVGQAGPVTSVDLWTIVLKQIWSFVLIVAVIYGIRKLNPSWTHSMQLIVCVPIGLVIGASLILVIPSQKRQIVDLVTKMIAELKRRRK